MTIEQKIVSLLEEHGLWPHEAEGVMSDLRAADTPMRDRWGDESAGYPPQVLAVSWLLAQHHALAWIDKHCPEHFARPLFEAEAGKDA